MKRFEKMGFYGILTTPKVGYLELGKVMVDAGLKIIQLRMKGDPRSDVLSVAKGLREIIPPEVAFIINDDPHLAVEVGADGVHLGQDDMDYDEARKIMGDDAIIGLSTHNPDQTRRACERNPDYIGVGPVFATPTKKKPDPVIGLDGMREMLEVASVPAVCLGGIDHSNAASVLEEGARSICAVRCVNASLEPAFELEKMLQLLGRFS